MQYVPDLNGIIGVTMPSEVTANVARKALLLAKKAGVPVLGIVENLRGFVCPDCGTHSNPISYGWGEKLAQELSIPFLAGIPMDPIITDASDKGIPFVKLYPDSPATKTIKEMTERILKDIGAS
jgi:ATP-binding protein involved in chromosome partitioning